MDFPRETLGVEEEFLLVDPATGTTVPAAGALHAAVAVGRLASGATVQRELLDSQVEAATGICVTAAELRDHLVTGRRVLADAARALPVALKVREAEAFRDFVLTLPMASSSPGRAKRESR